MTTDFLTAEQAVAGALLIDSACIPLVAGLLTANDFQTETAKAVFIAARDLDAEGVRADAVTIAERMKQNGQTIERDTLMQLMEITPTAAGVEEYAAIVRESSQRRRLRELGESLIERTQLAEHPTNLINDISHTLDTIEQQQTSDGISSKDATLSFFRYRDGLETGNVATTPTGFHRLDYLLGGGLVKSGLYLLAARPGVGKTTLALSIADNVAEHSGAVLFISLEMSTEQLTAKRISKATGISSTDLLTKARLDDDTAYQRLAAAGAQLAKMPITFNRRTHCTVSDIRSMARKIQNLRLIVVDYLGLLQPEGRSNSRYEAITKISKDLKTAAMTLGVPVLALAQLNRANESRAEKRPALSDLRDSGSLEQDADGVMLLHRDDYYEQDETGDTVPIELHLAKNRHSRVGKVSFAFGKAINAFAEMDAE